MRTNQDKADDATVALHAQRVGTSDMQEMIVDLMANLLHLANVDDLDPFHVWTRAWNHYEIEKEVERNGQR